uniref:Uncharacterized protein n=1 Tax=Arundo donax TaxID=35708 RepID=A0A0A9ASE8_ARUDO
MLFQRKVLLWIKKRCRQCCTGLFLARYEQFVDF